MKKNFTQFISEVSQTRHFVISILALLLLILTAAYLRASVYPVTVTGGSSFPVSADLASNSTTPGYTLFGDIVITEDLNSDFAAGSGTLIITAPTGWKFKESGVTVIATSSTGSSSTTDKNVTISNIQYTSSSVITIPYTVDKTNKTDRITISGIEVQAMDGANIPGTGQLIVSAGGSAQVAGLPQTLSKAISQTQGAARKLGFVIQPGGASTGETLNPQPRLAIQDQHGNTIVSSNSSVSLAIANNPPGSNGSLSPTISSVNAVNGVATFAGLSIDNAGNGYTLIATSSSLIPVTSSPFNITNKKPTITSLSQSCSSVGDSGFNLTITGTEFAQGAKVSINKPNNTTVELDPTSINATKTQIVVAVDNTVFATAGTYSIRVVNKAAGQSDVTSDPVTFTVYENLAANAITGSGSAQPCAGTSATYTAPIGFSNYNWSVPSGLGSITAGQGTRTVTVVFAGSGNVTLSLTATNACNKVSSTSLEVNVKAKPVVTIAAEDPEICVGESTVLKASGAESYVWSGNGISTGTTGSTITVSPTVTTTYTAVGTTNGCASDAKTITVIVNALPVLNITNPAPLCNVTTTDLTVAAITNNNPGNLELTYWQDSEASSIISNPKAVGVGTYYIKGTNSVTGCYVVKPVVVSSIPEVKILGNESVEICEGQSVRLETDATGITSGMSWYKLEADGSSTQVRDGSADYTANTSGNYYANVLINGCIKRSNIVSVQVNPRPTASATIVGDAIQCLNKNIPNTFSVQGVFLNGIPEWVSSNTAFTIQNAVYNTETGEATATIITNAPGSTNITLRSASETGCGTVISSPVTLRVNALPIANILEGQIIDGEKTTFFCEGTAVLTAQLGTNYSYEWFDVDNTSEPFSTERQVNALAGKYYVKVTDGNNCSSISQAITVKQTVVDYVNISDNQIVCYNEVPQSLVGDLALSSAGGSVAYQWQVKTSESGNFSDISGAISKDLVLGAHTKDTWYRRISKVGSCAVASEIVKISVLPQIVNTLTSSNQTVCLGGVIQSITGNEVTGGNGDGVYSYTWFQQTGSGDWEEAPGSNNDESYTPLVAGAAGTYSFRRDVTSGSCAPVASSNIVTITVQPTITGNTITGINAYCQGATATALTGGTLSGGDGTYSYRWLQSTSLNGTYTEVGIEENYTPLTATAGTFYFKREVTSGQCSSVSDAIEVTITPGITANTITGKNNYCKGETGTALGGIITGGNGANSYTFVWQRSATGINGSWADINNSNSGDYIPQTSVAGVTYYRRGVTSGNCTNYSNHIAVTVTENISNNIIATTAPASGICTGTGPGTLTGTTPTGGSGSFAYVWESSTTSATNGFSSTGIATATYNPGSLSQTTWFRRVVKSENCEVTSAAVEVKVNSVISNNTISAEQTICSGTAPAIITGSIPTGGNGTPYTYQWQRSTASATTGFTDISGATSQNYSSGNLTQTTWFRRVATSGGCSSASDAIRVLVNPVISNNTISAGPQTICAGQVAAAIVGSQPAGGSGSYTYKWEQTTNGSNWTAAVGINNERDYQPGTLTVTTRFRRIVEAGVCQPIVSAEHVVNVKPLPPKPTISNLAASYYTGDASFTMQVSPANLTGSFTVRDAAGQLRSSSSVFSPCGLGAGTFTVAYTATSNGCSITSDPVTVTIKQSKYTVVVEADPFPTCRGQITVYKAVVYRDVENVIYPYVANAEGKPVDKDNPNIVLGDQTLPFPNYNYPFPEGNATPQILKDNAYRYFQPIVMGGVKMDSTLFNYQWTKNQQVFIGSDRATFNNAGLSSLDYYAVLVTSKGQNPTCITPINTVISDRKYSSAPVNYEVTLNINKNPICKGESVTLSANLNAAFSFWSGINLTLYWMLDRGGVITQLGQTVYQSGNTVQFTTPGPVGGFQTGDKIYVEFSSAIDKYNSNKCSRGFITNIINMTVNQPVAISATDLQRTVCVGGSTTFTASATGTPLNYQWYKGNTLVGTNSSTLTLTNIQSQDAGEYFVKVWNDCSPAGVMVKIGTLSVNLPASISVQPQPVTLCQGSGQNAVFSVTAAGTGITYQWYKTSTSGRELLSGATGASYTVQNPTLVDAGTYSVVITGTSPCGNIESSGAVLTVNSPVQANPLVLASTYCEGDAVTMSVNATGTDLKYKWYHNGNLITNTSSSLTITSANPSQSGTYNVEVTGTCSTTPVIVSLDTLTVREKVLNPNGVITATHKIPNPDGTPRLITSADPVKIGETAVFTSINDFGVNSDALTYVWYVGDDINGWGEPVQSGSSNVYERTAQNDDPYKVKVDILGKNGNKCYAYLSITSLTESPITPLPVELIYFKAVRRDNTAVLTWATASEKNNEGFEVQVSQDGVNYRQLQFVATKNGNTSIKQTYEFVDKENGKFGTRYYRLRQLDSNGEYAYYGPQMVIFGDVSNSVFVYPNPFEREVKLDIDSEKDAVMEVTLTNLMGRKLLTKSIEVSKGRSAAALDLGEGLPAGIYIVTTRLNGITTNFKLMKK